MNVTIHQPTYLPYLGVFAKIASADTFIVYDTAQYEKGSVHNRQRFRMAHGSFWLTIPLKKSLTSFSETPISYGDPRPWYEKHWKAIEQNYGKTPYFKKYREPIQQLFHEGHPRTLGSFNLPFISFLLNVFGLRRKTVLFSELNIKDDLSPSEKLAEAVMQVGGTHYISGPSGKHYLDEESFSKRGISVSYFEFMHPEYAQYHSKFDGAFLPNMSSLDALFNVGSFPRS